MAMHNAGMFRARPRWTVSASGLAVPGRARPCRAGPDPQALTFIDRAWASPAPNPSLFSAGPRLARPPTPHFYWPDPSLLLARPLTSIGQPLTSIGQTPHFYWPDPSLLLARPITSISQVRPRHAGPCRTVSGRVGHRAGQCRASLGRVAMSAWHWNTPGFIHQLKVHA